MHKNMFFFKSDATITLAIIGGMTITKPRNAKIYVTFLNISSIFLIYTCNSDGGVKCLNYTHCSAALNVAITS